MDDERKTISDRWAPLKCLANVALLFAPIAIGLGILAMVSAGNDRDVDPMVTSAIQRSK
ncbi:hypothetical protein [Aminobacter aminovorans]|uniref:hypothetical protein n=1 Tax=Aminobacter aminovorans TaxID=83263 RepID=UPI00285CB380|nr:hypothetical protein [Aminobacter aminovorans]MDR7225167.1 hypothetical protein [Aminobacter aminovorans]